MNQRMSVHFNRADLGRTDTELTEEMLTDAAGRVFHGDDSTAMMEMLRRFVIARGVVVAFDEEIQRWIIKNTNQSIYNPVLTMKTKSEAYQFALECIVNTGGVQSIDNQE